MATPLEPPPSVGELLARAAPPSEVEEVRTRQKAASGAQGRTIAIFG